MVNNEHWHEKVRAEDVGRLLDAIRTKGEAAYSGCYLRVEK
jgi:hypothetical protein